jgi:hypothetical protein
MITIVRAEHLCQQVMNLLRTSSISLIQVLLLSCSVVSVDPEASGLVQRLISQRNTLIQPGLSYVDSSIIGSGNTLSISHLRNISNRSEVSCIIIMENWSKWLLGNPVIYSKYGSFLPSISNLNHEFSRFRIEFQHSIPAKCSPATGKLQLQSPT